MVHTRANTRANWGKNCWSNTRSHFSESLFFKMTNQSALHIRQQLTTKLSNQRLHVESHTVSQAPSKVSFGAIVAVRVFETQYNPSLAWYSKRELMTMRRDCQTLSRHYDRLSQQHPDVELLGLENARGAKERSTRRKRQNQYILLQQEFRRLIAHRSWCNGNWETRDCWSVGSWRRDWAECKHRQKLDAWFETMTMLMQSSYRLEDHTMAI